MFALPADYLDVPLDLEAVFRQHHADLLHSVQTAVPATPETVEDAVAYAWLQALRYPVREEMAWTWLLTVAVRQASKLHRRAVRDAERYEPLSGAVGQPDRSRLPARPR